MASTISGRCSVEQDAEVVRRARMTPRTPTKMSSISKNGLSSAQRRRGLFQPASPASSESSGGGLGHMSPLSSSLESLQSIASPSFSPNGDCYYDTPVKTPCTPLRQISVRSTLFPALQMRSLKVRRSPRSSQTVRGSPSIRQSMAVLQNIVADDTCSIQSTPKSSRRSRHIVAETVSSPSSVGTPPSQRKPNAHRLIAIVPASPAITSPGPKSIPEQSFYGAPTPVEPDNFYAPKAKPVTPENFYAAAPVKKITPDNFYAPAPPRPTLVIDSLTDRGRRIRRDSEASKRSYVSGAPGKRQRSTSRSTSRPGKRHKGAIPGVWHGIKKPKTMNKSAPKPKPGLSPNTRVEKLKEQAVKRVKRGKRLFEAKPRQRVAGRGKDVDFDDGGIIDTFPSPLIKRKKLPSTPVKEAEPDYSKKFVKHGARKAVFQLNSMKLELTNGNMRVKTPEKRRKLRAKKLHTQVDLVDFTLDEPETSDIQKDVENILQHLTAGDNEPATPPRRVQVEKLSDSQLMSILDSPSTKVKFVDASPSKMLTEIHSSPQRTLLANMSSLALNDPGLGTTGGILSAASNVLNDNYASGAGDNRENEGAPKLYPVFDPKTWKAASVLVDLSNGQKQARRKMPLVADDQYLLDAGQMSVGVVSCKECGVMYQAGDYLDEVAHNNVHNHLSELTFMGWNEERVVSRFKDGRIVMVTATDPKPWQEKAKKVVGVVDLELGFSENTLTWSPEKKVLLFVCDKLKQVVGCLVSEPCTAGYRMYPSIDGVDMDTCARDHTPCKVGVSRIWTAVHRRRRAVATRMFHALRRLSGDIEPDDVAFSIPSPDGKQLARSLVARQDFKVYGFLTA